MEGERKCGRRKPAFFLNDLAQQKKESTSATTKDTRSVRNQDALQPMRGRVERELQARRKRGFPCETVRRETNTISQKKGGRVKEGRKNASRKKKRLYRLDSQGRKETRAGRDLDMY